MPIYEFSCECGARFDRFLPLAKYAEKQTCNCGKTAQRRISAPFVQVDIPAYQSPIDGRIIGSRAQRREDLARSGCVEYDPGMKTEADRRRDREDAALDAKIESHVEEQIYAMPARKREHLAAELEGGMNVEVVRV